MVQEAGKYSGAKVPTLFLLLYTSPGCCFFLSCPATLDCSDSRWALLPKCHQRGLVNSSGVWTGHTELPLPASAGSAHTLRSAKEIRIRQGLRQFQSCEGAFPAPGWLHYNCYGCICTRRDLPSFLVITFIAAVPQVMQTAGNLSISILTSLCSIGFPRHS